MRLVLALVSAGCTGLMASVAMGQATTEPPLLQGPRVDVRKVPGVQERYVQGNVGGVRNTEEPISLPVFFEMLGQLGQESGSALLGLDEQQRAGVVALAEEMREDVLRYVARHTQEVKMLIAQLPSEKQRRASQAFGRLDRMAKLLDRVVQSKELSGKHTRQKMMPQKRPNRHAAESRKGEQRFHLRIGEPEGGVREHSQNSQDKEGQSLRIDRMMPLHKKQPLDAQTTQENAQMAHGDVVAQLETLWQAAPSAAQLQTRVWMLLRQDQQDALGRRLEAYQQKRQAERERTRLERDIARRTEAQKEASRPNRTNQSFDKNNAKSRSENDRFDQTRRSAALDPVVVDRALREIKSGKISERLWKRLPQKIRSRLMQLPENQRAETLRSFLERSRREVFPVEKNPHSD